MCLVAELRDSFIDESLIESVVAVNPMACFREGLSVPVLLRAPKERFAIALARAVITSVGAVARLV